MATAAKNTKPTKKMARPALGVDILMGVRVSPEMLTEIEAWAEARKIKKSEAVRQLLTKALKG